MNGSIRMLTSLRFPAHSIVSSMAIVALLLALGASACTRSSDEGGARSRPRVVCTTGMITDAARAIAGEHAEVIGLMKAGVDPHTYPLTRRDQTLLSGADVVLFHGLHLEGKLKGFLESLAKSGGVEVAAVAEAVPEDRLLRNELFGEYPDPHVWFDLELWEPVVRRITATLAEAIPAHSEAIEAAGEAYVADLRATHAWALETVATIPPEARRIVTSHDAYNYLGRAYGFDVHGLQGISTETEAGLSDIDAAVRYIREHGVPVIFAETSVNAEGVELLASRSGCRLAARKLYSDALGAPESPEGTFLGMFRFNLSTLVEELSAP